MGRTIADIAPETRVMAGILGRLAKPENADSIVTDADLSDAVGFNISDRKKYHLVRSARYIAERDHKIVIERVLNTGYRRLVGASVTNVGTTAIERNRRGSQRASKRMLRAAESEILSDDERKKLAATATILNMTAMFSKASRVEKLESDMTSTPDGYVLPEKVALKLFENGQ
jgi:hypothetical protein